MGRNRLSMPLTDTSCITAIRRGAYHRPSGLATYACLTVEEDFLARLREEALRLIASYPSMDSKDKSNRYTYVRPKGEYLYYSLLTTNGDFRDQGAAYSKTFVGKSFHQEAEFPALGEFIRAFPEAMNFTLRGLSGSSSIAPHEERNIHRLGDLTYVRVRLHLPIVTTPEARMMLEGGYYHFSAGTVYYFNNGCVHFANNPGHGRRIHLIWDLFLTRELLRDVFDQSCPDVRAPFFRKIGHYGETGYVEPYHGHAYRFASSRLGKMPDWTQPWLWNNLLRFVEYYTGKDCEAAVVSREEFRRRLEPTDGTTASLLSVSAS